MLRPAAQTADAFSPGPFNQPAELMPIGLQPRPRRAASFKRFLCWLFFANRGEFRNGDYEEIMNKASCLSLLSNAVLVWNTMAITNIVTQLRAAGETIAERTWCGSRR
jgi:hypothetical protein